MMPFQILLCSMLVMAMAHSTGAAEPGRMVFPGKDWQRATPESQGVDPNRLRLAMEHLQANCGKDGVRQMLIVRNGYVIWEGEEIGRVHGVWSVTKSFTSTVLGLLIDDGKCTLETLARDHLRSLQGAYAEVTLRHFVTMTSGYYAEGDEAQGEYIHGPSKTPFVPAPRRLFAPGTKYAYWDSAMNQLANVLTRIAGEPIAQVFRRRVADPIGMDPEGWNWRDLGEIDGIVVNGGSGNLGRHVVICARELARFGHLMLNRGDWNGRQVVSQAWVEAATSVQVPEEMPLGGPVTNIDGRGVYGFNWWVNGIQPDGRRKWPNAPAGTFAAMGFNNNVCFVVPEWQMVVVRLGLDGGVKEGVWDRFFEILAENDLAPPAERRPGD